MAKAVLSVLRTEKKCLKCLSDFPPERRDGKVL